MEKVEKKKSRWKGRETVLDTGNITAPIFPFVFTKQTTIELAKFCMEIRVSCLWQFAIGGMGL